MQNSWIKDVWLGGLNLLFPKKCFICAAELQVEMEELICSDCVVGIKRLAPPLCSCCGIELHSHSGENHLCGLCLRKPPPFLVARSIYSYDEVIRTLVARLKYGKDTSVVSSLGTLMRSGDLSPFVSCDYLVPVPLHRKRLQQRGFNQALLLANGCFGRRDPRLKVDLLQRTVHTVPQVSLNARQRRNSLKGVFRVNPSFDISGKTICLIDDVYTTGTTVSQCSSELVAGGAAGVKVLTLARANVGRGGRRDV